MRRTAALAAPLALAISLACDMALAEEPTGAEDARSVIQRQLDAFQAQDLDTAYSFAAPTIRRKFVTPDIFGSMVKRGYPMVWDPQSTEFLDAEPFGPQGLVQRLRLIDRAGRPYIAEYQLLRVDGEWRISGVRIVPDDSFGA